MEFKGFYAIPAPPEAVWAALHDPGVLTASIPGCESVTRISDSEFLAKALVKIGPFTAHFSGRILLSPQVPPAGYAFAMRLRGEGQGGAAGFARGESEVLLAAKNGGTELSYGINAIVGGQIAQAGQKLLDSTAMALADRFFAKFTALMTAPAMIAEDYTVSVPESHTEHAQKKEVPLSSQVWVAGLIGIVFLMLILFSIVL